MSCWSAPRRLSSKNLIELAAPFRSAEIHDRDSPGYVQSPTFGTINVSNVVRTVSHTTTAAFMAALDSNIVTIALPKISADLSAGFSLLGWVLTAYLIVDAALILQSGKAGDKYERKRIYLIGFVMFGTTSFLCVISQNAFQLITFFVCFMD